MKISSDFFKNCAFISIDIQDKFPSPEKSRDYVTWESMQEHCKEQGLTPEDFNAALDFKIDVAFPNALEVAKACRQLGLPMIFIHWGYLFPDAMDMDPEMRPRFLKEHGHKTGVWPLHLDFPYSRPARQFDIQEGEYVLSKTAADAFPSSNLDYVLRNLKISNIVAVGWYTGICYGQTVRSARERGYKVMVVEDATSDQTYAGRLKNIEKFGYDYLVDTETILGFIDSNTR